MLYVLLRLQSTFTAAVLNTASGLNYNTSAWYMTDNKTYPGVTSGGPSSFPFSSRSSSSSAASALLQLFFLLIVLRCKCHLGDANAWVFTVMKYASSAWSFSTGNTYFDIAKIATKCIQMSHRLFRLL